MERTTMRGVLSLIVFLSLGFFSCTNTGRTKPVPPPDSNSRTVRPDLEHRVGSGETLAAISTWYTGNPKNWETIRAANPGLHPQRLRLGQVVFIPGDLVVRREPLPRSFLKDRSAKATPKKDIPDSVRPEDTGGSDGITEPKGGDGAGIEEKPMDSGFDQGGSEMVRDRTQQPEDFAKEPVEVPPPNPPADDVVEAPKAPVNPPEDEVAKQPAPVAPPDGGKQAGGSDAEREKLLDELLSQ